MISINRNYHTIINTALALVSAFSLAASSLAKDVAEAHEGKGKISKVIQLPISSQGTYWPPSGLVNENGDFVVLGGQILVVTPEETIVPKLSQFAIVSKETVPPLDGAGREDFSNIFAAPHTVLKTLDLSAGSKDLDMVLYTPSFGPPEGSFGGGIRIPREGESTYNLNGIPNVCGDIFPTESQRYSYTRGSFPLHQYPILGYQGDQLTYNPNTGEAQSAEEIDGDTRPRFNKPITIGEFIKAKGEMAIKLIRYNHTVSAFTAAKIKFKFRDLMPNSVYTLWALNKNTVDDNILPTALGMPNIIVTDERGRAQFSLELENPFPAFGTEGFRLIGVEVAYHPDYQTWGACAARAAVGAEVIAVFDTVIGGIADITNFETMEMPSP